MTSAQEVLFSFHASPTAIATEQHRAVLHFGLPMGELLDYSLGEPSPHQLASQMYKSRKSHKKTSDKHWPPHDVSISGERQKKGTSCLWRSSHRPPSHTHMRTSAAALVVHCRVAGSELFLWRRGSGAAGSIGGVLLVDMELGMLLCDGTQR